MQVKPVALAPALLRELSSHRRRMTLFRAEARPSVSFASVLGSPSGLKLPRNRPMDSGTEPSVPPVITLRRERAQAVPQRPVRRPKGPDRTDVDGLEKGPTRPQTNRTAGQGRFTGRLQRDPLREPHRNPCKYLPHDFPNRGTVYAYYAAWRDEGIFAQINYDLTGLARVKEGRKPEPTASVVDTQSVRTSTNDQPGNGRREGDRRSEARHPHRRDRPHPRRDRHRRGPLGERPGNRLLDQAKETYPTISKSWVDTGFRNAVVEHGATLEIDVEVVNRNPNTRGFEVLKRRWVVETEYRLDHEHRRLARDYETLTASSEYMIHIASITTSPSA